MFHVSVLVTNATMVIYGVLFGGGLPVVFITMMCMFHVSVLAPNATMVIYGVLFNLPLKP